MHSYLKSIGFSNIKKEELTQIMETAYQRPDAFEMAIDTEGTELAEIRIEVAERVGLAMRGNIDDQDEFTVEYYFPYYQGGTLFESKEIQIMKESDRENFKGVCDDAFMQMDLIFHLQNMIPLMKSQQKDSDRVLCSGVKYSALSTEGKIIMPVFKTDRQRDLSVRTVNERQKLMSAAKEGDAEAYEKLTIDDIDTYAMLTKRLRHEDVYSIVESTFMPNGIENDKYQILGEVIAIDKRVNNISKELLYILSVKCSNLVLDICINSADLLGVPAVGRRFKGTIWLQGYLENC